MGRLSTKQIKKHVGEFMDDFTRELQDFDFSLSKVVRDAHTDENRYTVDDEIEYFRYKWESVYLEQTISDLATEKDLDEGLKSALLSACKKRLKQVNKHLSIFVTSLAQVRLMYKKGTAYQGESFNFTDDAIPNPNISFELGVMYMYMKEEEVLDSLDQAYNDFLEEDNKSRLSTLSNTSSQTIDDKNIMMEKIRLG